MPENRHTVPGEPRGRRTYGTGLPGRPSGFPGTFRSPSSGGSGPGAGSETSLASQALWQAGSRRDEPVAIDLEALLAKPGLVDELAPEDIPALLERCAVERNRVAAVERLAIARLARLLPELTAGTEGLLTAREAAHRLGMSEDWVRDHGKEQGIAVPLVGKVERYDPRAVRRVATARHPKEPPRD